MNVAPKSTRVVSNSRTWHLWTLGALVAALVAWGHSLDPGSHHVPLCTIPLSQLPRAAQTAANLSACTHASAFWAFLRLDLLLIPSYAAFFWCCLRWGATCFASRHCRGLTRQRWLVGAAVLADVAEDGLLIAAHSTSKPPALALYVASSVKVFFLAVLGVLAVLVLLTGLRRFLAPWTIPPPEPARLPKDHTGYVTPSAVAARVPDGGFAPWYLDPSGDPYPPSEYGLGLSGGGIRSAAFSAGVLQTLASPHGFLDAQFLATVSGGGYIGVSAQALLHETNKATPGVPPSPGPYSCSAPETTFMRANHRYLGADAATNGRIVVAALSGVLLNLLLVGGLLLMAAWATTALGWGRSANDWGLVAVLLLPGGVLWQLGLPGHDVASPPGERRRRWATALRWTGLVLTLLACVSILRGIPLATACSGWAGVVVVLLLAGVGRVAMLVSRKGIRINLSRGTACASFAGAWIAAAVVYIEWLTNHATSWWSIPSVPARIGYAAVMALFFLFADQTWYSPHPLYKQRLASTFAVVREGTHAEPLDPGIFTYLDEWAEPVNGGPQILICATASMVDITVPPVGIRAVPFVFSHDYVGSQELGWWKTEDFRRALGHQLAGDGTLQAATAISGAAIASALGTQGRIPSLGTMFALTNARLGVWLPNPRSCRRWRSDRQFSGEWARVRRPTYLLREVSGWLPAKRRFAYVSDGGHLDNLGLLELLRRRCKTIVLIDASGDTFGSTGTLDGALQLAHSHLGVKVCSRSFQLKAKQPPYLVGDAIDTEDGLRGLPRSRDCVERIDVAYPGDAEGTVSTHIYLVKAAFAQTMVDDEDAQVAARLVALAKPAKPWRLWTTNNVPRTSTLNQWLTDDQYDALVRLGRAAGRQANAHLTAPPAQPAVEPDQP